MKFFICNNCSKHIPISYGSFNKYCSSKCDQEFRFKIRYNLWIKNELIVPDSYGARALKRLVSFRDGYKCSECSLSEWRGKKLSLELEHKDGNHQNNEPENVCLLCPNCHSQTPTFRGKNKGKGRSYFRNRFHKNKN